MTIKIKSKQTEKKAVQMKLKEFLNGEKISKGYKLSEAGVSILKGVKSFEGHAVTKEALEERDRKFLRKANSYKGMSYETFFNSLKAKGELKDGHIVDCRLVSYLDGDLIGGLSSTADEILKEKFSFKMKNLFHGFNKDGLDVYRSLKTAKQKTDFLKNPKENYLTSSKKGIVRFYKIG